MSTYDVAIIGAGIGGSCAAIALAQHGAKVILFEAGCFPRHKVCGEFLSPESRGIFERLGVFERLLQGGANPIRHARLVTRHASTPRVTLPGDALGFSRFHLDYLLWQHVRESGVLCREQTRVNDIKRQGENFAVTTSSETHLARVVIDATGRARLGAPRSNATPRFLGIKAHFHSARMERDLVELHFWRGGYCGIAHVESGLTNICLLERYNESEPKQNAPDSVWERVLRVCPRLANRLDGAQRVTPWSTTANVQLGYCHPVARSGVLCVGDAVAMIHPLAGDGMAMAARSGELAAAISGTRLRGGLHTQQAVELYALAWQSEFAARLRYADALGKVLLHPAPAMALIQCFKYFRPAARHLLRATRGTIAN